jgi:AcrR family transcriptional regulator
MAVGTRRAASTAPKGEPVNKHTARRLETRSGLLRVARQLLDQGRLESCSVDQICQAAGISRAGFYLHFANKAALLDAMLEEMGDWYLRQFRKLTPRTAATEEGLIDWLRHMVRGLKISRHAIQLFATREFSALKGQGMRRRREAVLLLGRQVPGFRLMLPDGGVDEERRLGLLLLVFQTEALCNYVAFDAPEETELGLRGLARQYLTFMAPVAEASTQTSGAAA